MIFLKKKNFFERFNFNNFYFKKDLKNIKLFLKITNLCHFKVFYLINKK